jgi:hypothetical protein
VPRRTVTFEVDGAQGTELSGDDGSVVLAREGDDERRPDLPVLRVLHHEALRAVLTYENAGRIRKRR